MQIPKEILLAIIAGLGSLLTGVGVYIKKRLAELDTARGEVTELKVKVAELETEKKAVKEYLKERSKKHTKQLNEDLD